MTTQLNELDNGPGKVKNLPKINYGKGLRPEGTAARVAKDYIGGKELLDKQKFAKKIKRSIDDLQKIIDKKVKVTITYSDYMMAWNGFPDLDPHDIISGIAKRTGGDFEHIQKQMDKFAKQEGYKNFMDGYYEQVKKFHENPEGYLESESLDEMAMDTITHKKFGKIGWHNESGVHKIKRNGKTVFSGSHKEAAKHWATIKHITECVLEESDKNKLRNLAHTNPEAADAAARVIREYMDNPKKQFSQIVAKVVEETGITKSQLMKVVDELGISFNEEDLSEGEYTKVLKAHGFKKSGKLSDGAEVHSHPVHGDVAINKHNEWHHIPSGSTREDGFEGTTGQTLATHLSKLK